MSSNEIKILKHRHSTETRTRHGAWSNNPRHVSASSFTVPKFRGAFTLAEVLITLGVIGVVAAVTMPTLIKHYQKTLLKNQFKKTFAVVSQAYNLAFGDVGYTTQCHYGKGGISNSDDCFALRDALEKHLKIVKTCRGKIFSDGCLPEYKDQKTLGAGDNIGGSYRVYLESSSTAYVLQDGTIIFFYVYNTSRGLQGLPTLGYIDVNGKKGPNKWGHDVQSIAISYDEPSPLKLVINRGFIAEEGAFDLKELRY